MPLKISILIFWLPPLYSYCRRHSGPDMESMKAVALAAKARSLADFQKAVKAYKVNFEHWPPLHLPSVWENKKLNSQIFCTKEDVRNLCLTHSIWGIYISPPLNYRRLLQRIFSGAPFLPLIEPLLVAKICPLLIFFGASKLVLRAVP